MFQNILQLNCKRHEIGKLARIGFCWFYDEFYLFSVMMERICSKFNRKAWMLFANLKMLQSIIHFLSMCVLISFRICAEAFPIQYCSIFAFIEHLIWSFIWSEVHFSIKSFELKNAYFGYLLLRKFIKCNSIRKSKSYCFLNRISLHIHKLLIRFCVFNFISFVCEVKILCNNCGWKQIPE